MNLALDLMIYTPRSIKILSSKGFRLDDTKTAINIVHEIRSKKPIGLKGEYHPFARNNLSKHPFYRLVDPFKKI